MKLLMYSPEPDPENLRTPDPENLRTPDPENMRTPDPENISYGSTSLVAGLSCCRIIVSWDKTLCNRSSS